MEKNTITNKSENKVDNFDQITEAFFENLDELNKKENLHDKDKVIFGKIIRRERENPDKPNYIVKRYMFKSKKEFLELRDEIKEMCHFFNARFYISTNIKSLKSIAGMMAVEMTKAFVNEEYAFARRLYDSVSDRSAGLREYQNWIIDIDSNDQEIVDKVIDIVNENEKAMLHKPKGNGKVIQHIVKTLNGTHLLVRPHDIKYLNLDRNQANIDLTLDVKKNAVTLVYYNGGFNNDK